MNGTSCTTLLLPRFPAILDDVVNAAVVSENEQYINADGGHYAQRILVKNNHPRRITKAMIAAMGAP